MKKFICRCILLIPSSAVIIPCILFMLAGSCDNLEEVVDISPSCYITSPENGIELIQGEIITVSFEASDSDGDVIEVLLEIDNIGVGTNPGFPCQYLWNTCGVSPGIHTIKVTAKDNSKNSTSHIITILIIEEGSSALETGTVDDYDGNTYKTVKIGTQWWMAENLKTTHFSDGTEISLIENNVSWYNLDFSGKAYCYYDNSITGANIYGALYNWAAAMYGAKSSEIIPSDIQGVCPDRWHLPSDGEWIELEMQLGMNHEEAWLVGWRGTNEGSKMKAKEGWINNGNGTNSSGFSALPSGIRSGNGLFSEKGMATHFWSTTEYFIITTYAFNRKLSYDKSGIGWFQASHYYGYPKNFGFSVRCIKD